MQNFDAGISEFGERRVAAPGNRADVEFLYDVQPLLTDDISAGSGSAVHQANGRHLLLSVGGVDPADVGGRRLHYWTPYTPGSGQEIDVTGVLDAVGLGGGVAQVFLRSTITGTTTLQTINQADWQARQGDVDFSKAQIFRVSFQSLKVGRLSFVMAASGGLVRVAEINNDNLRASGYWQYANLPPYWKIYHDGDNTVAEFGYGDELNGCGFRYVFDGLQETAKAIAICATVKSQGGVPLLDVPGFPFSTAPMEAVKTISTTLIPVLSIQVASVFNTFANRALVIPTQIEIETNQPIDWQLIYRPTLTGASFVATDSHSGTETDVAATTITGGYRIDAGMTGAGSNQRIQDSGFLDRVLMSLGSGTADILTLAAVRSGTTNASVRALIKGKTIR